MIIIDLNMLLILKEFPTSMQCILATHPHSFQIHHTLTHSQLHNLFTFYNPLIPIVLFIYS